MAEPLKNHFGPDVARRIGGMITNVHPEFDGAGFVVRCLDGFEALELTPRARHIAAAMAAFLPADRARALEILIASLGDELEGSNLTGMAAFLYLPHTFFVAEHGLEHFEISMRAQYEITKRFTAEFSIRAFLTRHADATLARLRTWAHDPSVHVRRLVSEGTRPRLPWAPRLPAFQADPTPVLELLELLKDDPELYVRRSVANNLNDIAKDHPDVVVELAKRWWRDGDEPRRKLVRHGLRSLVKQGHPGALAVLGYGPDAPATCVVRLAPSQVPIGGKLVVQIEVANPTSDPLPVLIDFRIHFVKARGATAPKVFKGAELTLPAGGHKTLRRTVSLKQHATRKHYPGTHAVEVLVNGDPRPAGHFELV